MRNFLPRGRATARREALRRRVGLGVTIAVALTVALVAPATAAGSTLSCPYVNQGSYVAPATTSWKVDSVERVTDSSGKELRAFAGYMVPQAIVADGDTTYIAFFDQAKRVTVASKKGAGAWAVTTLDAVLEYDSHSHIDLAVDQNRNLHVVAQTSLTDKLLKYWVTSIPADISTLARSSMFPAWGEGSGANFHAYEELVSYPRFYTGKGGQLFFRYRAGAAGGAWTIVYQFNGATRRWELSDPTTGYSGLAKVFLGYNTDPQMSAYPSIPELGPDGNFHMVWTWRRDATAGTNSQIHYAYSADMRTWKNIRGETIAGGQFLYNQAATMVDAVPQHGGVLNDTGIALGFDPAGKAVVSYFKYVTSGSQKTTQLFTARPSSQTGSGWSLTQVSNWSGLYDLEPQPGSVNGDMSVNVLEASSGARPSGSSAFTLDYQCQGAAHRMVLDAASGRQLADIALTTDDALPTAITESAFPAGYKITHRESWSPDSTDASSLVLTWEAGPYVVDNDFSGIGPYPAEGSPLTVVRMAKR